MFKTFCLDLVSRPAECPSGQSSPVWLQHHLRVCGVLLATAASCGLNKWCGQIEAAQRSRIKRCKNSPNRYKPNKQVSSGVVQGGLLLFGSKNAMQSRCCGLTDKQVLVKTGPKAYTVEQTSQHNGSVSPLFRCITLWLTHVISHSLLKIHIFTLVDKMHKHLTLGNMIYS